MDGIEDKLSSLKHDIENNNIENALKIKTEVEKTFLIANNLFAHIPCNKSHLKVDKFAEMLMPEDMDQGFQSIVSKGDGNCFLDQVQT